MDVIIGCTRRERIYPFKKDICDLPSISCSTRESLFDLVEADCPKVVETSGKSRCRDAHTFRSGYTKNCESHMERTLHTHYPRVWLGSVPIPELT
jgi:hypothetical protein